MCGTATAICGVWTISNLNHMSLGAEGRILNSILTFRRDTSAYVSICKLRRPGNLLSIYVTILSTQTTLVYTGIGEVAAQWDMVDDDVGGYKGRGREAKKKSSCSHFEAVSSQLVSKRSTCSLKCSLCVAFMVFATLGC